VKLSKPGRKRPASVSGGAARSLWNYGGVILLAALVAVLATAVGGQYRTEQLANQIESRFTERTGRLLAARLGQGFESEAASLRQLSTQPALIEALQARDEQALRTLTGLYGAAVPAASRLLAVPEGLTEPNLTAEPPIGYALLDLMRRAEREQQAPPVEVHLPGQPAAHINLLQPVLGPQGAVVGHLIATYPMQYLQNLIGGLEGAGLALQQAGTTVLQLGSTGGADEQRLPVPNTRWQLVYAPAPVDAAVFNPWLVPAAVLAALVLIAIAALVLLRRRIKQDAGTLVDVLRDLNEHQLRQSYPVRLTEFKPAAVAAFDEARKLEERLPVLPREGVPPPVESAATLAGLELSETPAEKPEPPPQPAAPVEAVAAPVSTEAAPAEAAVALNPVILRAYDVRGIVGTALTAEAVHALGRAIGSEAAAAGQQEVVVARDGRLSSPELSEALIAGLMASGREVIDIGRVPTPVMNFATFQLGTGAGVMVTGSHNPRDYNGLKIVIGGRTLSGDDIQALGRRVEAGDFIDGSGSVRQHDVLADYIDRITQDATLHRPLRIVVDCGNGVAGAVAPQVFRAMGCEVEELFCEVDGYFPNHHPDPTVPANLDALISLVRLQGADLGLAFDGDGDRLGVVDAKGRIIWADRQLMLFSADVLGRHPGGKVVFDVKCSAKLAQVISEAGGVPVMWKSGHSMIKGKLAELDAPLGGEMSGHIFFKDRWYGFDDAIYAGARLLELLSKDSRGSVELFAALPDAAATPEIRLDLAEGEAEQIMAALEVRLAQDFGGARLTTIDGIRADFNHGWGLVRASNTQPCLVLRFEADDKAALAEIQERFRRHLQSVKPDLALPF
jgi:phosphomannomutase/phosphoglucomutase